MAETETLKVFYDGGCNVCDAEMSHYRNIAGDAGIEYVNINDPDFDPSRYGKSQDEFMQQLHVRDGAGDFHTGVDAFRKIWESLPGARYHFLSWLTGLPGVHFLASIGYRLFAENRHRLPRKIDGNKKGTA